MTPRPIAGALVVAAVAGMLTLAVPRPAAAAVGCVVEQSAQAALQRQLAIIDASKTNVSSFFSGPNSCISSGLLSSFDLSNLIPDLAGFLQNGLTNLYRTALDQAKQQVCRVVNGQIQQVVGQINSASNGYRSMLGGDLSSLMGGSNISLPTGNPNFGNYNLQVPTINQLAQPAPQQAYVVPAAPVQAAPVQVAPAQPTDAYPWLQQ